MASRSYPSRAAIMRTLDAVHAAGVKIGGCEVAPDGTIRVLSEAATPRQSVSAYDDWKARRGTA